MFILKEFDEYPDPFHKEDQEINTLENLFGMTLACIKTYDDQKFVDEMIDIWNSKHVFGKRRLVWIVARHFQFMRMKFRDTHTVWQQIKYAESVIEESKKTIGND